MLRFRALVDRDRLRPCGGQFQRIGQPGLVIAPPDRRSRLRPEISFTRPALISLPAIFCAAATFRFAAATRQRSLRCAAALSIMSSVSVSLIDMDKPFAS